MCTKHCVNSEENSPHDAVVDLRDRRGGAQSTQVAVADVAGGHAQQALPAGRRHIRKTRANVHSRDVTGRDGKKKRKTCSTGPPVRQDELLQLFS